MTADPTQAVIERVIERLDAGPIDHVIVATTSGTTGVRFAEALAGRDIQTVCVTHHVGFKGADVDELQRPNRERLRQLGAVVVTAGHALSGVGRSISTAFGGTTPGELIAHTLRLFGQGTKVCVECAVMAADAASTDLGNNHNWTFGPVDTGERYWVEDLNSTNGTVMGEKHDAG